MIIASEAMVAIPINQYIGWKASTQPNTKSTPGTHKTDAASTALFARPIDISLTFCTLFGVHYSANA